MLVVDIGNSRIKWGWWQAGAMNHQGCAVHRGQALATVLDQQWQSLQPLLSHQPAVWVACVAGTDIEQALHDWLQQHYKIEPVFLRTTRQRAGVLNSYPDPAQHGVDRWAALLGARARYADTPVCIIDCGTAVTVDLMTADGQHLGGLIMPGLDILQQALLDNTAGVAVNEGDVVDFASNTADAVSSGTLLMLRAALQQVCENAQARLGATMKIIITGGSSKQVMALLSNNQMHHEPDLVLHGLVAAAG